MCLLTNEWINKMWYRHVLKYHLAFKRRVILTYAVAWMNAENIILSEISQSQKDRCVWFHLFEVPKLVKIVETESRMVVAM